MNSLYKITKVGLFNSIGINKLFKSRSGEDPNKGLLVTIGVCIGILLVAIIPFIYATAMADVLTELNLLDLLLISAIMMSTMITFFTSIYKAQGVLFSAKDYEMLVSLPIKQSVILASKMIQLLILNYLFAALILIPTSIVYFSRVNLSPLFFAYLIIVFIFAPLIPIVLASIIAFILSYISSKMKYKNMFLTLGSFAVVILIMGVSMNMQNIGEFVTVNSESIIEGVEKIYPPAIYFTNALATLDIVSLLKFIVVSVVPFVIFLFIFSKFYKNINSKLGESFKSSNYKLTTLKTASPIKALIRKEIKGYFSCPTYVLNTLVGMVIITITSIASLFFGRDIIAKLLDIPEAKDMIPLLMIGGLTLCVCMSCTTNSSISLEGKKLWILKSSPIDVIDIFKGKIAVNLLILIPIILLNSIILLISLKMNLSNFIWMIIIPSLYGFAISIGGILINLYFPKLDWVTEISVVKQSISVIITILLGLMLGGISLGILIGFKISNFNLYFSGLSVTLILLIYLLWRVLNKKGRELFNRL